MIITKTPFRMSFFGGGTDMEDYFKENGGAVICHPRRRSNGIVLWVYE